MKAVVLGDRRLLESHLCDLLSSKSYDVNIFNVKKLKYKRQYAEIR